MKAKVLVFWLKSNLFQKCKNGGEKSFTTYLWTKVDVKYCEPLYIQLQ